MHEVVRTEDIGGHVGENVPMRELDLRGQPRGRWCAGQIDVVAVYMRIGTRCRNVEGPDGGAGADVGNTAVARQLDDRSGEVVRRFGMVGTSMDG